MSEHKQLKWNGDKSMPIGEDVPMLIPVSIVLVVFVLFLFSLFTGFGEKSEIVRMSQVSLNIGEYMLNIKYPHAQGIVSPPESHWGCKHISELNISSNYLLHVNITRLDTNRWWCWGNVRDSKTVVTNAFPTLMIIGNNTIPAKVVVSVGK